MLNGAMMNWRSPIFIKIVLAAIILNACAFREEKADPSPEPVGSFAALQTSVLGNHCIRCHNPARNEGGLDLTSYAAAIGHPGLIVPGNAEASSLYQIDFRGEMPPRGPRLSDEAIQEIKEWIDNGANEGDAPINPNPVTPPTNPPQPPPVNPPPVNPPPVEPPPTTPPGAALPEPVIEDFTYIFREIFAPRCLRCHGSGEEEAFLDISDYAGLFNNFMLTNLVVIGDAEASLLYQVLIDTNPKLRMPANAPALSEQEIELIRGWINNGALETIQ